jgi:FAD/FMN-containing dehydrogenase
MSRAIDLSRRGALRMIGAGAVSLMTHVTHTRAAAPVPLLSLQEAIEGRVVARGARAFDSTRQSLIWNRYLPSGRSPDAIVHVTSENDVVAAVRFAKTHGLKIAIRSSGHNYHAAPLRNGGLLLDLGTLTAIHVDRKARRASVEPGVKSGELMAELAPLGLAFPVGHCSDVGMGGYLLGGGFGWNFGEWGPACMSVTGMQMVTASGDLIYADATQNADLYWAARGAGRGFFAAVTRYDLSLHSLPSAMRSLSVAFELDSALAVAEWLEGAIATVHPTVEVICSLIPPGSSGTPLIAVSAFAMTELTAAASAHFGSLREPPPDMGIVGQVEERSVSFEELLRGRDAGFPSGKRMAGDMRFSNSSLRELVGATRDLIQRGPPAPSVVTFVVLGGRSLPPRAADAAFSMDGQVDIGAYAFWDHAAQDAANRDWVRSVMRAVEPHSIGSYISEVDLAAQARLAPKCFSPAAWSRLAALKREHDPENRFYGYEV